MTTVLVPAESLVRVHGRGLLLSILEKETILTRIKVLGNGHFTVETKDWDIYWQPLHKLGLEKVEGNLKALHSVWRDYICSGFSSLLRQEFCFRYFSLLDVLQFNCREAIIPLSWVHALKAALGFECFGVVSEAADGEVIGAGTCTLRNPCYLLAKLKMPDVLDDPQFLPIITVAGTEKPELFYYYRQYTMSPDSPMSLLFYPAVSVEKRAASFRLINSLAGGVSYGIDPRAHERAQRLYHGILRPIMQANNPIEAEATPLEFVDVGAGSGNLAASICRQILDMKLKPRFRLWFVDLEPANPVRFFRAKRLRTVVDSLSFLGDDYRSWMSRTQPLPPANGLRIALVSRLFNNLSCFSIRCLPREELLPVLDRTEEYSDLEAHRPSVCLAPGGGGVNSLAISNTRVVLQEGRTFAQVSLSDFYRGIYLISRLKGHINTSNEGLFTPVRTFDLECLLTSDGKSVISCLVANCDYVIIEDADLKPRDLVNHLREFSLRSLTAYDMTKALGLTGNYAYIIWLKSKPKEKPNFGGEQIW